ncbi:interleukin-36 alpha-like [Sarcophilus harrisii]|uniref:Interleukin-1 n=1 Tax=Sarcophilus harrisii TaxID=9305 RepID=A0A7N4NRG6_SARHA|nr:interleukin-36 alpha-like [Sarcophilus harrisii]
MNKAEKYQKNLLGPLGSERHTAQALRSLRIGSGTTGIHSAMEIKGGPSASLSPSDMREGKQETPDYHQESQSVEYPSLGKIRDIHQQVWILQNGTLIATPHGENVNPVTLEVLPCRDESLPKDKGEPIYVGIKASGCCLHCKMSGEQPILILVEKNLKDLYTTPEAVKPFLFYRNQTGITSTLESAAFPGWFICTSSNKNQPVTLTHNLGGQCNTAFYLNIETPVLKTPIST